MVPRIAGWFAKISFKGRGGNGRRAGGGAGVLRRGNVKRLVSGGQRFFILSIAPFR